jgi:hypothetical protein
VSETGLSQFTGREMERRQRHRGVPVPQQESAREEPSKGKSKGRKEPYSTVNSTYCRSNQKSRRSVIYAAGRGTITNREPRFRVPWILDGPGGCVPRSLLWRGAAEACQSVPPFLSSSTFLRVPCPCHIPSLQVTRHERTWATRSEGLE